MKIRKARLQRRLKTAELFFPLNCKLHGVKTPEYQGAIAQSRAGDTLQLVHLPSKAYPHKVYAYNIPLNRILGLLHTDLAQKLIYAFGKGFCRDGEIINVTGERYETRGCNIRIFDTAVALQEETDFSHLYEQ